MAHKPATPGTGFREPLYLLNEFGEVTKGITSDTVFEFDNVDVSGDIAAEGLIINNAPDATPVALTAIAGTPDDTTWALPTVEDSGDADPDAVDDNFATIAEVLNRILAVVTIND